MLDRKIIERPGACVDDARHIEKRIVVVQLPGAGCYGTRRLEGSEFIERSYIDLDVACILSGCGPRQGKRPACRDILISEDHIQGQRIHVVWSPYHYDHIGGGFERDDARERHASS